VININYDPHDGMRFSMLEAYARTGFELSGFVTFVIDIG